MKDPVKRLEFLKISHEHHVLKAEYHAMMAEETYVLIDELTEHLKNKIMPLKVESLEVEDD